MTESEANKQAELDAIRHFGLQGPIHVFQLCASNPAVAFEINNYIVERYCKYLQEAA